VIWRLPRDTGGCGGHGHDCGVHCRKECPRKGVLGARCRGEELKMGLDSNCARVGDR